MSYFDFLLQWYNWPYLAGLILAGTAFVRRSDFHGVGAALAARLGFGRTSGPTTVGVFALVAAILGLTVNGALHDYWPSAQEVGFFPGFFLSLVLALLATRRLVRFRERHFPEIKAVGFGARHLAGREGRVVSRSVSPDYRAGRAQVMGDDETLHIVLCKTRGQEIPYGAKVVLGEYDEEDRRYYVERADESRASEESEAEEAELRSAD